MADIVRFPPSDPPPPATPELLELRETWRGIEHAVHAIRSMLDTVSSPDDLSEEMRFQMQWELAYLLAAGKVDVIQRLRLPPAEYHRRRDRLMRSLGLAHLL